MVNTITHGKVHVMLIIVKYCKVIKTHKIKNVSLVKLFLSIWFGRKDGFLRPLQSFHKKGIKKHLLQDNNNIFQAGQVHGLQAIVLYNRKTSGHVIVGLKINHMSRRDDGCWGRGWMTLNSNTCQVSVLSAGTWILHYSLPLL